MLDPLKRKLVEQFVEKVFPKEVILTWNVAEVLPEERFWVIGGTQGPRWLIPHDPRYSLSVLNQWHPYRAFSDFKWHLLLAAYRANQLHRLPSITSIGLSKYCVSDWTHLGSYEKQLLTPVIYIGTAGSTRKAVVSLVDSPQSIVAVAKIPLEETARANILQEAKILNTLNSEKPGLAPQPLLIDTTRGLAVQTAIYGKLIKKQLTSAHIDWLKCLATPDQTTTLQEQLVKLQTKINQLPRQERNGNLWLQTLLRTIDDTTILPSTWIHGDFAPWNLKWVDDRAIAAVDWEEAQSNGLPLYDLFHYHYIQSHLLGRKKSLLNQIWAHPLVQQYLKGLSFKIDPSCYKKLALFYLTDLWLRSIHNKKWDDANFFRTEISYLL